MNRRILGILFLSMAVLSACSSGNRDRKTGTIMLFSPNGEPLNGGPLGRLTCREAMAGWFDRVDANRDSGISRGQFMADAQTQFQRMDIDKNGYLLPEEVDRFRLPYEQQSDGSPETRPADRHAGRHGPHNGDSRSTAANPADQPDPVMSADTNNDLKVTPDEFMTQARSIFAALDADHNGSLDRDEALKSCEHKKD